MRWAIVLSALLLGPAALADFNLDEIGQLDKLEQQDLLGAARKAAGSWDFDTAERYLAQARQKGQADADLKAVATLIADNRAAKLAKEQKEAAAAQAAEAQRQATASASSGSGGSGSAARERDTVTVEVKPTCALISAMNCSAKDLQLSGGIFGVDFKNYYSGSRDAAIRKGLNFPRNGTLTGQYNYTVTLEQSDEQKTCSGSFAVDGTKENVIISIMYSDCDAHVNNF